MFEMNRQLQFSAGQGTVIGLGEARPEFQRNAGFKFQ
jgi:hypothetical protein